MINCCESFPFDQDVIFGEGGQINNAIDRQKTRNQNKKKLRSSDSHTFKSPKHDDSNLVEVHADELSVVSSVVIFRQDCLTYRLNKDNKHPKR